MEPFASERNSQQRWTCLFDNLARLLHSSAHQRLERVPKSNAAHEPSLLGALICQFRRLELAFLVLFDKLPRFGDGLRIRSPSATKDEAKRTQQELYLFPDVRLVLLVIIAKVHGAGATSATGPRHLRLVSAGSPQSRFSSHFPSNLPACLVPTDRKVCIRLLIAKTMLWHATDHSHSEASHPTPVVALFLRHCSLPDVSVMMLVWPLGCYFKLASLVAHNQAPLFSLWAGFLAVLR